MIVGHTQTEFCVDCESAVGREEGEGRRLEWVLGWEGYLAVVASALEIRAFGTLQYKVPF